MGGIVGRDGAALPVQDLIDHVRTTGSVVGFPNTEPLTQQQLIGMQCDVLIPAAVEGVLNEGNADSVRASVVIEGANMPTTAAADEILNGKSITVIPDLLANAGGVIASYFEWTQNLQQMQWSALKVNRQLRRFLARSYREVARIAGLRDLTLRQAAYVIAVERVASAEALRGAASASAERGKYAKAA
jgi:glutamate dehydrogenase (NAD(P)+)